MARQAMRITPRALGLIMPDLAATKERRRAFGRVLAARPEAIAQLTGSWYERIAPWRKTVDEFDRRLLGILGERRIGLHFSSACWEIPVELDPTKDALRTNNLGVLNYFALNLEAGNPRFLNHFPGWVIRGRDSLIVIDREQAAVKRVEGTKSGPEPLTHVIVNAQPFAPVFGRSTWLLREPLPLLSILDTYKPEKMAKFTPLDLVYRSSWQRELTGTEAANFYIMLFSVANGLALLDALTILSAGRTGTVPPLSAVDGFAG
ncbi:MAG: hypothetical protein WC529_01980 [Candidatus Margulisiibacteriota bacterium]